MDRQPPVIEIVRLVAEQVEKLALQHGYDEIEKVVSVSLIMRNNAVFWSPIVSSSNSSSVIMSRSSLISKGARRAPQLTKMLLSVLPETKSQGLFHQIHKEVTFCGLPHGADA